MLHHPKLSELDNFRDTLVSAIEQSQEVCNLRGVRIHNLGFLDTNAKSERILDLSGAQFFCEVTLPAICLPRGGCFRAAHFQLPVTIGTDTPQAFDYALAFRKSHFYNALIVQHATFAETVDFDGCEFRSLSVRDVDFRKNASFLGVSFQEPVRFDNLKTAEEFRFAPNSCQFEVSFRHCDFGKGANFSDAKFPNGFSLQNCKFAPQEVSSFRGVHSTKGSTFHEVAFLGYTDFSDCILYKTRHFTKVNLSGANLVDIQPPLEADELVDVTWPRKRYFGLFKGRYYVHQEEKDPKSISVLKFYGMLHRKYYEQRQFVLASEFYVSFLVLKRRATQERLLERFVNHVYSILGRYGESIKRPFILLLLLWLISPIFLLWVGIRLDLDKSLDPVSGLPWQSHVVPIFSINYWRTFLLSISLSTFFQSNELRPPLTSLGHFVLLIETAFNALLASLVAIGIRRAFSPKKPME